MLHFVSTCRILSGSGDLLKELLGAQLDLEAAKWN